MGRPPKQARRRAITARGREKIVEDGKVGVRPEMRTSGRAQPEGAPPMRRNRIRHVASLSGARNEWGALIPAPAARRKSAQASPRFRHRYRREALRESLT
jgi:hypothetical protein